MLTSPISVTIGATTYSLVRINQDNYSSKYLAKGTNEEVTLDIKHQYEKADVNGQYERHNVDLRRTVFDPTGLAKPKTFQAYTVLRAPRGTLSVNLTDVLTGLDSILTANGSAIVAWES